MAENEKWAVNIAFVGDKELVMDIIKQVEYLEEQGHLNDCTTIQGPFESLQGMLKDRIKNLGLITKEPNQRALDRDPQQSLGTNNIISEDQPKE